MKKYVFPFGVLIIIVGVFLVGYFFVYKTKPVNAPSNPMLTITSSAFASEQMIPQKYTCDGNNINPPLKIEGVSTEARSLALIADDPDAPMGTWVHWVVWDIDPSTKEIAENSVPAGAVEGTTSFGKPGYGGPCPPSGTHRYFFKVYALDTLLELPTDAKKEDLEQAIQGHILDQGEIMGTYSKQQ